MIIDSHLHLGSHTVSELVIKEEDLLSAMDGNHLDAAIILPLPGASNELAAHDEIAVLTKKYPGKFYGGITLNPHTGDSYGTVRSEAQFFEEVQRCVKALNFVCIKLHPSLYYCAPNDKDALKVFQSAVDYDIPVIIHTGIGIPESLPSLIIPCAKQFPKLKIVMAHSGAHLYSKEAIVVAQECPNIYLETSWCPSHRIKEMINAIGAERVMFGSDMIWNIPMALAGYYSMGLAASQLEQCLSGTVREVFKLP